MKTLVVLSLILLLGCTETHHGDPAPVRTVTATPKPAPTVTVTSTATPVPNPTPTSVAACRNNIVISLTVVDGVIKKYKNKVANDILLPNRTASVPNDGDGTPYADYYAWAAAWHERALKHEDWLTGIKAKVDLTKTHLDVIKVNCLDRLAKVRTGETLLCKSHVITALEKIAAVHTAYTTSSYAVPASVPTGTETDQDIQNAAFDTSAGNYTTWSDSVITKLGESDTIFKLVHACLKPLSQPMPASLKIETYP